MCSHRRVILHLSSKFRIDRKIGGGVDFVISIFQDGGIESEMYFRVHLFKKVEIYLHAKFR